MVITGEREKTIDNRFCDARHENKEKRREAKRPARFDYIFGRARSLENRLAQFNKIEYPMISAKAVSYTEGYRSGHNEAVLKICERCRRKKVKKPCKH